MPPSASIYRRVTPLNSATGRAVRTAGERVTPDRPVLCAQVDERRGRRSRRLGGPAPRAWSVPPRSAVAAGRGHPPGARRAARDPVSALRGSPSSITAAAGGAAVPARGGGVAADQRASRSSILRAGPGGRGQGAGCRRLARPRGDGPGWLLLPVTAVSRTSAGPGQPRRGRGAEAATGPGRLAGRQRHRAGVAHHTANVPVPSRRPRSWLPGQNPDQGAYSAPPARRPAAPLCGAARRQDRRH
jgi:hypothetical protein